MNDNIGIESVRRSIEDKLPVRAVIFLAGYVGSGKTFILEELKKRPPKTQRGGGNHDNKNGAAKVAPFYYAKSHSRSAAARITRAAAVMSGCATMAETTAAPFMPSP